MNNPNVTNTAALVGRLLLAALFIVAGYGKIGGFAGTAGYIASKGLPMPQVLAALTLALELGGGILLAIGFKTRWVALAFFLWLIPTTFIFHQFWGIDAAQASTQQTQFLKNLAIMGGML
jgi:putative oxidoreductase